MPLVLIFSQISEVIWMKFGMLTWPLDLMKLMLNVIQMISTQWRKLCLDDFMKYTFDIGLYKLRCLRANFCKKKKKKSVYRQAWIQ